MRDALRPSCRLKLPKIALKVPLLFLAAHSCDDDYYDGGDDDDNDYDDDVNADDDADDDEEDGKVERPQSNGRRYASMHPATHDIQSMFFCNERHVQR